MATRVYESFDEARRLTYYTTITDKSRVFPASFETNFLLDLLSIDLLIRFSYCHVVNCITYLVDFFNAIIKFLYLC